jgi:hypothetical protein
VSPQMKICPTNKDGVLFKKTAIHLLCLLLVRVAKQEYD